MNFDEWYGSDATDEFSKDLAQTAAKQLRKLGTEYDRQHALAVLQDRTSLYSPYVADLIDEALGK